MFYEKSPNRSHHCEFHDDVHRRRRHHRRRAKGRQEDFSLLVWAKHRQAESLHYSEISLRISYDLTQKPPAKLPEALWYG